ncbi:putative copper export protein [Paenibacillus prosopidis]|uniref:Putative copper export protein n=2 Tax=Paenibacillus prosopidis TaxID=630520 RepID=A0A368W410_9BACL|nr:putative copper export protein [Paenibacillus prosopidis]
MIWACLPGFVSAHAYILQSTPLQNAELTDSPSTIRIKFTEKIDTKLSTITLHNSADGSSIPGTLSSEGDVTLLYTIPKLDKGVYKVSWQVLSLDTHITDGSFRFAVGMKLEQTKPDETISLDGDPGQPGNSAGSDSGATASPKPGGSQTTKPSAIAKPKPSSSPSPSPSAGQTAAGSETMPSPTPKPTLVNDTGNVESSPTSSTDKAASESGDADSALDEDNGLAAGASGGPKATDNIGSLGAGRTSVDESITTQEEVDEAALTELSAPDEGGYSHAEGEHNHAGGNGLMITLRVFDIFTGALLAGILFFRYVIWREHEAAAPFGFSLMAERIVIGTASLIWIGSGLIRLSMLSEHFGGLSLYTVATGTVLGKVASLRPAGALFLLLLAFAPVRERLWANRIKLAAAAALIVTFPLTGHAYASVSDAAAAVIAHTVHMGAAAIWFGGLAGLLSLTFDREAVTRLNRIAERFSVWALPSMALILVSGIWLSITRLSSWGQLVTTEYGRLILAKSGFMLLVLVIAALHKLLFMPRIAQAAANQPQMRAASRGLMLGIRFEVLLAVLLFVLAGWLSSTPPPPDAASQPGAEPVYWHVMGDQAHMSMRISDDEASGEQAARLDVWLPEGMGAPVSAIAKVTVKSGGQVSIPLDLQPAAAELYEYPGFTKYTYLAKGVFIDETKESLITIDLSDEEGNSFHYEHAVGR